jgi:hypothetical protein
VKRFFPIAALCLPALAAHAGEWSGYIAGEWLGFAENGAFPGQHNSYLSISAEPEYIHEWNEGDDLFTFKPFLRVDQHDDERTHADVRELSWVHAAENWEIMAGIGKVFWGVTESLHLVDIINQTDQVENGDGEDKLGQPMVNLSLIRDRGVVDLFVLPGFRERTFPSVEGRPRFGIPIDTDNALYESGSEQGHVDFAIRWSHYIGSWDFGLAHFSGTSREPRFVPAGMSTRVVPLYELIDQTSLDLQSIVGSWLWKLEVISRSGQGPRFTAAAGGFEYTFVGVNETAMDVGVIGEYLFDDRGDGISTSPFSSSPFQNDLVLGARLTLNDAQTTEVLASIIIDLDGDGQSFNVEASRRFGDDWKLSIEARGVSNISPDSIFSSFEDDHRLRIELARYF